MKGDKASIIDLDSKVSPVILASIFGCNVSLIYQDVQAGKLPSPIIDFTYREAIQFSRKYMLKNVEVKLLKEQNDLKFKESKLIEDLKFKESKLRAKERLEEKARNSKKDYGGFGDDGLPPLLAAKTKQDIRLGIAKENQLWIRASIERGDYLATEQLIELCEPIIGSIRQALLSLALTSGEAEKAVDECMGNLKEFGTILVEQADFDSSNFVDQIMKREVDYTEIDIDSLQEPLL